MSSSQASTHPRGSRCVLSETQVLDIFRLKTSDSTKDEAGIKSGGAASAKAVAKKFGVSTKTVRDIWKRRTWYRTTLHLEPTRSDTFERLGKRAGRPKGVKDSKPRMRSGKQLAGLTTAEKHDTAEVGSHEQEFKSAASVVEDNFEFAKPRMAGFFDFTPMRTQEQSFQPHLDYDAHDFVDPFHDDWKYWSSNSRP